MYGISETDALLYINRERERVSTEPIVGGLCTYIRHRTVTVCEVYHLSDCARKSSQDHHIRYACKVDYIASLRQLFCDDKALVYSNIVVSIIII